MRMGTKDFATQAFLIDASFCSKKPFVSRKKPSREPTDFLDAACIIGDALLQTVVRYRGTVSWPCLHFDNGAYRLSPADFTLYEGHAGIALFFSYLAKLTGEPRYLEVAKEGVATIRSSEESTKMGAFDGLGSSIYIYSKLAGLWNNDEFVDEAEALLKPLSALIDRDESFDIISGTAGCILVLLRLAKLRPQGPAKSMAIRCGERMLFQSCKRRGFAHGLSGIAVALMELAVETGDNRFQKASEDALALERNLLVDGTWSDEARAEGHWCHGAPGIALSRLSIWKKTRDKEVLADAKAALENSIIINPSASGLCHGHLGNLEAWVMAANVSEFAKANREVDRIGSAILRDFRTAGWCTRLPSQLTEPGLMTGIAGIGYGFLRLSNPNIVPNVLTLG